MRLSSLQPNLAAVRFGSQPLGFNNWTIDYHAPGRVDLVIKAPESVEQMNRETFTSWAQLHGHLFC